MVHEVVGEVDAGKCIVSREVELEDGETLEQLEERMHGVEHGLVVEGVRKVLGELEDGGKKGEGV
jgi:phosphoribosylglycinamide formyltransferase